MAYLGTTVAAAKSLQSCPNLCDPIDGSPPGFPIPGILQARNGDYLCIDIRILKFYIISCSFKCQFYKCLISTYVKSTQNMYPLSIYPIITYIFNFSFLKLLEQVWELESGKKLFFSNILHFHIKYFLKGFLHSSHTQVK